MRAALLVLAVSAVGWADVPPPRPPALATESCRGDADCEVSTFAGCCGSCCPRSPYAASRQRLEASRQRCAVVDCALPSCKGIACEQPRPAEDFRAVCRAGACELVAAPRRPEPPPPDSLECRSTSDCIITDFACCGSCCPLEPRAEAKARLAQDQAQCGRAPCPMMKPCRPGACKEPAPLSAFVPACVGGRCVAEPAVTTPAFECRADTECALTYPPPAPNAPCRSSPCGCCPGTEPTAVPAMGPEPLVRPPSRPPAGARPPAGEPPFGLSEGTTRSGSPPPACSPCPGPSDARAACRGGRCVVLPRVQRIERR